MLRQHSFHESRDDVVPGMIAAIETRAMLIKREYDIDPLACAPLSCRFLLSYRSSFIFHPLVQDAHMPTLHRRRFLKTAGLLARSSVIENCRPRHPEWRFAANPQLLPWPRPGARGAVWALSHRPPMSGRRVLITPAESLQMHCLDLLDGSHRWSLDRSNAAFLACVDRGVAVVVGDRQLTAIELNTGRVAAGWPLQLPEGSLPSGRGYHADGQYYLPLNVSSQGEVATIQLGLRIKSTQA